MKYTEIPLTFSKEKYKGTDEYIALKEQLLEQFVKDEITMPELNRQLENLLNTIYKYMDTKRKTNKELVINAIEDLQKLRIKQTTEEVIQENDLDNVDTYTFNYQGFALELPTKEYLHSILTKMMNRVNNNPDNDNIYSFFSLTLGNSGAFNSSSKKILLYDNEEIIEDMEQQVKRMIDILPSYGDINKPPAIKKLVFTLTLAQFRSIKNWFYNDVASKIEYKDFTLFTANQVDIDCQRQCVEFLGEKWDNYLTFEAMLASKKEIIYYKPINGIKNVLSLNDLVTDGTAKNTNNNDCQNVARILIDNGHMGVICKIKPPYNTRRVQKQIIIDNTISATHEIFVDIESFTENTENQNKKQIPYLICWSDNDHDEVHHASGDKCITQFVKQLMLLSKEHREIILYAWYGSGYDYQHILPYIKDAASSEKMILKNNSIIYAKFSFDYLGLTVIFKDPFLFLMSSLDKAAKAFNVLNKGSFPHTIIKGWESLGTIYDNWVIIQNKIIEHKTDNKVGLVINRQQVISYEQEPNYKSVLEKAREYCNIDVIAMKQVWNKFRELVRQTLNMEITDEIFTLSQLSMKLMQSYLPKGVELHIPDTDDYEFIKDSIYGGRVIANNGIYKEDIIYADVVSLYPSSMRLLKHSYGKPKKVNKINWDLHGVYKVKLTHKDDEKPDDYMHFVPRRIDDRLNWAWFKEHTGTYHTYDLLIAKDQGFDIEVITGIEYPYTGYIFSDYIDSLYALKEAHSNCSCPQPCSIRHIAKIALNGGGYGKFVQKPIEKDTYVVRRDVVAGEFDKIHADEEGYILLNNTKIHRPEFYNLDGEKYDKMIIETHRDPVYATQNGVSILSGSRYRLYHLCKSFDGIDVLYSDTDSIFIRKSSINFEKFKQSCGSKLGMLDETIEKSKDNIINKLVICGPKMYGYTYKDKDDITQEKIYCKGVPKDMVRLEHLEILYLTKRELQYIFTILRKKITTVDEREIAKNVGETSGGLRI